MMNKCGLALLQDLEKPERIALFRDMEKFSHFFLRDRKRWWPEVPWPPDPLHQWSRQLEYPYAFWQIQQTREKGTKVLDAGSGVTFFPFYLAMNGYDVSCVDNDERLNSAFAQLNKDLPRRLNVNFRIASLTDLPNEDNTFSHVCCISVIEHIPRADLEKVLREFYRVLIPGGICILTVDVSLQVDTDAILQIDTLDNFITILHKCGFELLYPVEVEHETSGLLSTIYFRKHNPALLPWTHPVSDSFYHKARFWVKTNIFRRSTFNPLGVALFSMRRR